jgi:hypothetical protein
MAETCGLIQLSGNKDVLDGLNILYQRMPVGKDASVIKQSTFHPFNQA